MKKIFSIILSFILINSSVYGEEVVMDGLPAETEAVIIDGKAYFPVRELYESIGCDVEWDNETETMLITKDNHKKSIKVKNGKVYEVDGGKESVDYRIPINVINSRFYIPLREMFEKLGYEVKWNGTLKRVEISEFLSDEKSAVIENRADMSDDTGIYNYLNGGLATVYNGYIYYSAKSEEGTVFIYRLNMDGTNKAQIAAVRFEEWGDNGEYVNFCGDIKAYNNELYFRSNFPFNIYKVNIDNGLCEAVVFLVDGKGNVLGSDFYLKDGFLYYAKEYDVFEESFGVRRNALLKKELLTGDEKEIYAADSVDFFKFEVRGDKIYIWDSFDKYTKMDTDGNNIETDDLKVLKNMVYNGKNYSLLRRRVLDNKIFYYLSAQNINFSSFNIKDDAIYILGIENNRGNAIYKADEDGENFVKITDGDNISDINIAGDWIFYIDNDKTYMVKIDGSQKSEISD